MTYVQRRQEAGEVVTGLLYVDSEGTDCHTIMQTTDRPLNELGEAELCPGSAALEDINQSFR